MNTHSVLAVLAAGISLAACDSSGSDESLVGSWIRTRDTGEMRDRYVFGADGSFTFDENKPDEPQAADHMTGTYVAADGVVTATATNTLEPGQSRLTFSYYAGPTQFTTGALLPRAAHDGVVGVWTGSVKIERLYDSSQGPSGSEAELDFRADGTFRATTKAFDGNAPVIADGTWTDEGSDTFRTSVGSSIRVFTLLDDAALTDYGRVWQRD